MTSPSPPANKKQGGVFPCDPVAKSPHSQCRAPWFNAWSRNWIPHATTKSSQKIPHAGIKTRHNQINKYLKKKKNQGGAESLLHAVSQSENWGFQVRRQNRALAQPAQLAHLCGCHKPRLGPGPHLPQPQAARWGGGSAQTPRGLLQATLPAACPPAMGAVGDRGGWHRQGGHGSP